MKNPKEEFKQENCCTPVGQIKRYVDCHGCDKKPKQEKLTYTESAKKEERISNSIMMKRKQETVDEAAEKQYPTIHEQYQYDAFIEGAKWIQERMYSEEELKNAFKIGFTIGYGSPVQELDLKNEHCERWFNKFKNI